MYANLEPEELDVDLGQRFGLQFQAEPFNANGSPRPVNPGETFVVPVVLNSASNYLEVFDIHINFDSSLVRV